MGQANELGSPPPFLKKGIGLTPDGLKALNAWFQFLLDGLPIPGDETIEVTSMPGMGRAIQANLVDILSSGGEAPYPFQVTLVQLEDESWTAWINEESSLLISAQPNNNQTITQLGIDNAFPISSDGDLVYLDVQWTTNITGSISTCKVTSFGDGGSFNPTLAAWASGDSYVFNDGGTPPIQQGLSVPIAQITFDVDGNPALIPLTINNLLLQLQLIDLIPAYIAVPFYGRYQD